MAHDKPIPIYFAQTKEEITFNPPHGLTKAIDEFIRYTFVKTNVKFSRNDFLAKSVLFYAKYLFESSAGKEMMKRLKVKYEIVEKPCL